MADKDTALFHAIVQDVKRDLEREDLPALKGHLMELQRIEDSRKIHSVHCREFDDMRTSISLFLFKELPFREFVDYLSSIQLLRYEVLKVVSRSLRSLPVEDLLYLTECFGFPDDHDSGRLVEMFTDNPDPAITEWLDGFIMSLSASEAEKGASLSSHEKSMSTFRFIRWGPRDHGLSSAIRFLGKRSDTRVKELMVGYLENLPWGEDCQATEVLLQIMTENPCLEYREAVRRALTSYHKPAPVRLLLLSNLTTFDRDGAIQQAVRDLGKGMPSEIRYSYLDWLGGTFDEWLVDATEDEQDIKEYYKQTSSYISQFKKLDTRNWSGLQRSVLAKILTVYVPEANTAKISSFRDRILLRILQGFLIFRLDHMGCVIPLVVYMCVGYGIMLLMNLALGKPDPNFRTWDLYALWVWLLFMLGTTTTHFSGHETPRRKLLLAFIFWGLLFTTLMAMILVRL